MRTRLRLPDLANPQYLIHYSLFSFALKRDTWHLNPDNPQLPTPGGTYSYAE